MRTTKTKSPKTRPAPARTSTRAPRDGVAAPFKAYAIGADGVRQVLDAHSIVVDLGGAEVEIGLFHGLPLLARQLQVGTLGDGVLVVGPGDASSICVSVEPHGGRRLRPS
jgi:hypothetical protein